jgi:hypothetical protein
VPKADKLEHAKRVETVRQLILSGTEAARIVQTAAETWKIKDRQTWNYIKQARAQIQAATLPSREYLLAEHVAVRRSIRERARQAKDLRAELAAAQDEAKLFGLYAPTQIEVDDLREKSDSELIHEWQSILDAARTRAGASDSE